MHNLTSGFAILWCPCCISSPQQMLHNIFHHKTHVTACFPHKNFIIVTFMLQCIQGNFRCKNAKNVLRHGNSNKINSKQYLFWSSLRKYNKCFWQCISIFNQNGNYAFVFIDEIIICMRWFRNKCVSDFIFNRIFICIRMQIHCLELIKYCQLHFSRKTAEFG